MYRDSKPKGVKPPQKTQRVLNWDDLPKFKKSFDQFEVGEGKDTRTVLLRRLDAQVLKGLTKGAIYAASLCRIGQNVSRLRNDHAIDIRTQIYREDGHEFGVYKLADKVRLVGEVAQ